MFGLFKKRITLDEFGECIVSLVHQQFFMDDTRALAMRFKGLDWQKDSKDWSNFLENRGVSIDMQRFHHRLWTHASIQAGCTQFDGFQRLEITKSAMKLFKEKVIEYDFDSTFISLEKAYNNGYIFDFRLGSLDNIESYIRYLPNPNVGVLNAKYIIESFIFPCMPKDQEYIDDDDIETFFKSYSSTTSASVATVSRAIDHLFQNVKL